ncbi:MAG TPA: hypothetical protein VLM39_01945, partial [Ignavibacteriaceae bacterium]|nr:hypothetical protein [Ignavibacteriaceae bacterium]
MIVPLIAGLLIIFLLQLFLSFIIKDKDKKGILISLMVLMFFTYGIVHEFVRVLTDLGYYKYLLMLYALIFAICGYLLIRSKKNFSGFGKVLNITSITLIIINLVQIIAFELNKENLIPSGEEEFFSYSGDRPDIYYIILDGYANSGILKEYYEYDNAEFVNYLVNKGFYVTTQSRSNYSETLLS